MNGSGFQQVHPVVSFSYYIGFVLIVMLMFHPLFLLAALLAMIGLNLLQDGGRQLYRWRFVFLLVGGFSLVVNPLFNHRGSHILFYFQDQAITFESVAYGAMNMLLLLCVFTAFLSYNLVITPNKFLYLFSRFSPKLALMTMIAIRFVPLLKKRLEQIALVQRTRGVTVRMGSVGKRARDGMKQLHILLSWSLEEAIQTADSMNARGYGTTARSSYHTYRWNRRDKLLLMVLSVAAASCIAGWFYGLGHFQIYPELGGVSLKNWDDWCFAGYLCYVMLPLLVEGKERCKWRFSKSIS